MNRQLQTLPQLTIEFDGVPLAPENLRTLWETRVQEKLSRPTLCEMTFLEPTETFSARPPALGASWRVSIGGTAEPLFVGEVTALEYFYESSSGRGLRVRGYDALHRLRKLQPIRAHVQVTLADVAREMCEELGLVIEASADSPLWQRIIQSRQTDFELLSELAERCGIYFTIRQNTLHLLTLEGVGDSVSLRLGESLLTANLEINSENVCRSVVSKGWDALRVETFEGLANFARTGRSVDAAVEANIFGTDAEKTIVDEMFTDQSHAEALAQAELDREVAQEIIFSGIAEGDSRLHAGTIIRLENIAPQFAGQYVLATVNHVFDSTRGFVSEISSQLPKPMSKTFGPHPQIETAATLGVVTQVDDPEGFGRVRVKLPNYNDLETDWLGVLAAGAGLGKGLLALPDVDDTVLILLPSGDPAEGIILGGLYGSLKREDWDWGVEEGAVRRYSLQTPNGQRIRLDDGKQTVRVENSDGSFLEMSPEKVCLHANRDLEIEAPGRAVTIRAKTIDFEQS